MALLAFGQRVREARHDMDWTLEDLAEVSGLHWTYVGQVERGRRNISLLNILRLAEALDINPRSWSTGCAREGQPGSSGGARAWAR